MESDGDNVDRQWLDRTGLSDQGQAVCEIFERVAGIWVVTELGAWNSQGLGLSRHQFRLASPEFRVPSAGKDNRPGQQLVEERNGSRKRALPLRHAQHNREITLDFTILKEEKVCHAVEGQTRPQ